MWADTTARLSSMSDGSNSSEVVCFPTLSLSSFGGEVLPQDKVNPRRH